MNLDWSPESEAFRARLVAWLDKNLIPDWTRRYATPESLVGFQRDWDRRLFAGGWAGIWWPKEFGGSEATLEQRAVYAQEMARVGAPDGLASFGRIFIGPGIMKFGTPEQRDLLPPILSGEAVWCQGFSEPEAGSDLASLRTSAVRDGESYRINGTKIWTTRGHLATHCLLLARTDPAAPKHKGLTAFLLKLPCPGLTVRPLPQINSKSDFNQLYFDDVRVDATQRLGEEGQGWEVALYVLGHERGAAMALRGTMNMEQTLRAWFAGGAGGPPSAAFMRSTVETVATRLLAYKIVSEDDGRSKGGQSGPVAKLFWTEAWQRMAEAAFLETGVGAQADHKAAPFADDIASLFLDSRRVTISGGTAEIQRNLIATRLLGLPR